MILFVVIALLMATDLTIEFRHGESLALQSFELVIFVSALSGIAFHWWQMAAARRRSARLDLELTQARAEALRSREDARRECEDGAHGRSGRESRHKAQRVLH